MQLSSRSRLSAVAVVLALGAAACGGSDEPTTSAGPADPASPADAPAPVVGGAQNPLPAVDVVDLQSGATVDLASFHTGEGPVLVWFWAPYCPSCNREAPEMAAFEAEHRDDLTVVGLGTQNDLAQAEDFVERHGLEFTMLWDTGFESWQVLGVRGQPAAQLFSAEGELLGSWTGFVDRDEVLSRAGVS